MYIDVHLLSGIIFFYIAILMFKDIKKDEETLKLSLWGALVFALGVSLDSFGVGFATQLSWGECVKCFLIFTTFSAIFTYIGLKLGKLLSALVGEYSVLFGAVIMAILGVMNIFHVLM